MSKRVPINTKTPPRKAVNVGIPKRRRWRLVRRLCAGAIVLVLGSVIALTQTPLLKSILIGRIDGMLGVSSSAERVTLMRGGVVVVKGLRVRTPALPGTGGEVLSTEEAQITLDLSGMLTGRASVKSVKLIRPRVRLSVNPRGVLNLGLLKRPAQRGRAGRLPALTIIDGVIELGEHDGEHYQERSQMSVRGGLYQRPDDPSVYDIELTEKKPDAPGAAAGDGTLHVTGLLNADTGQIDVTMEGLDLEQFSDRTAPGPYRELWAMMDVRGEIDSARFAYAPGSAVEASLELRAVDMNVPIEDAIGGRTLLAMREVSGPIQLTLAGVEATLQGFAEDIEVAVALRYGGLTEDAPFFVRLDVPTLTVEERSVLLGMAPEVVRTIFENFSQPSMVLSGWVSASRGAPRADGTPAQVISEGAVQVAEGMVQYEQYPYPFEHITGRVEFDADEVRVIDFRGVSPTGAHLSVSGRVAPPDDKAAVDIRLALTDVPVDPFLRTCLPENIQRIFDILMDMPKVEALYAKGDIVTSASAAANQIALAEARRALADARASDESMMDIEKHRGVVAQCEATARLPVFDMGGLLDLDLRLEREAGAGNDFRATIDVRSPMAGLLPHAFAYPVVAHDVLVRVNEKEVAIEQTRFDSPTGATGTAHGRVAVAEGATEYTPDIDISIRDVPMDEVLLAAIPGDEKAAFSPARAIRKLAVRGAVKAEVRIFPDPNDLNRTTFDVHALGQLLAARPSIHGSVLSLDDMQLDLTVGRDAVRVNEVAGRIGEARVAGQAAVDLREDGSASTIEVQLQAEGLDLSAPVEAVVAAFAPEAAAEIAHTRGEHLPGGHADLDVEVSVQDEALEYAVHFTALDEMALNGWGGRLQLLDSTGSIELTPGRARFEKLSGAMGFDGAPCGHVALDGEIHLDDAGLGAAQEKNEEDVLQLIVGIEGGDIGSLIVRAVAQETAPEFAAWMNDNGLGGRFAADVVLSSHADGKRDVTGVISPGSLSLVSGGERLALDELTGEIELSPVGGRIVLDGQGDGVALAVDGQWARDEVEPFSFAGRINGRVPTLSAGVRAALPGVLNSVFEELAFEVHGPVSVQDGKVRANWFDEATGVRLSGFEGEVTVSGMSMDPGVTISDAVGTASVRAWQREGEAANDVSIAFTVEQARAASMLVHDVHGRVRSTPEAGSYVVQVPQGALYDGRLSASGAVRGLGGHAADGGTGDWELHASFDRVDFKEMLKDLRSGESQEMDDDAVPGSGELFADMSLRGAVGGAGRQGRGMLRLQTPDDAPKMQVLQLPGLVQLVKLSSLQVPVDEPVTFAYAEWYVDGSRMIFEEVFAESASVAVVGTGELRWPGLELDITFTTQSLLKTPVLTELTELLRNEVATARVTGTLYDPEVKYQQLQATRSLFDAIVSGDARRRDRVKSKPSQVDAGNNGEQD